MADLVSEWLTTNYPGLNIQDATRLRLLELVGSEYSYLALPDLWSVYFAQNGYTGSLGDQFFKLFEAEGFDHQIRNPFYAIVGAGGGGGFNPASLFAGGEQGGWYDPSDLSTMFQDVAGATPVTAAGQPVGRILDKSKGLALGATLVTNGDFSGGTTDWTADVASLSVVAGRLRVEATAALGSAAKQVITTVVGRTYEVRADIEIQAGNAVSGAMLRIQPDLDGSVFTIGTVVQVRRFFTATTTSYTLILRPGNDATWPAIGDVAFFDNISVREVAGNHLTQATAAARPAYQTSGGLHWLQGDGVDDILVSGASAVTVKTGWYWAGGLEVVTAGGIFTPMFSGAESVGAGSTTPDANGIYQRSDGALRILGAALRIGGGTSRTTPNLTAAFVVGTPFFAESRYESGTLFMSNGSSETSVVFTDGTTSTTGAISLLGGRAAKAFSGICIDRPLTTAEKADVQAYCRAKAGI